MFNELETLLEMTNAIGAMSAPKVERDDAADLNTVYVDMGMPSDKLDGEPTVTMVGSSSNVETDAEPVFEETPLENADEISECLSAGLGHAFKRGFTKTECCCGDCSCGYGCNVGDCVSMANDAVPVIFIVKNNDGELLTCAKPTSNKAEFMVGRDGVWPEYVFEQDKVKPMLNASIDDIIRIIQFNDAQMEAFDGKNITDEAPMKAAADRTFDNTITQVSQELDDILGAKVYADMCKDSKYAYGDQTSTTYDQPRCTAGYKVKFGD